MPKSVHYKSGSVIFFTGDKDSRIYILKSGNVMLRSLDIETGGEVQESVKQGEFFGVGSALGRYPREEDAAALTDAEVIQFTIPEFEVFAGTNNRILLKMLKVFSNQLRAIHTKVSSMLNQGNGLTPEEGLRQSATHYATHRQASHAKYIWERYLELYPEGSYVAEAKETLQRIQDGAIPDDVETLTAASAAGGEMGDTGQMFASAENHAANQRYDEAIQLFTNIASSGSREYAAQAQLEIGKCLLAKNDNPGAIKHLMTVLKEQPSLPGKGEALFVVGQAYVQSNEHQTAKTLFTKALESAGGDDALSARIRKALGELES